jgi:hypothetical protein
MTNGGIFLYSGGDEDEEHRNDVGILLSKKAKIGLIESHSVSERIITARFKAKVRNVSIVQCYAPTEISKTETKIQFYHCLNETVKISRRDVIIVMGYMNAMVGHKMKDWSKSWEDIPWTK